VRSNTGTLLVAFLTIVTLVCLSGFQVTNETSSVRLLGRLGSALIELDRWLPAHRADIELEARDRPDQPVVLADLPIDAAIPPDVALNGPEPALRASISQAMGEQLYEDGYSAIQDDLGESHLGVTEPLRWTIGMLDSGSHSFWQIALVVSGLALLAICAGHFWVKQSPLPGFTIGAAAAAILALLAWLAATLLSSSLHGALNEELGQVARDVIWIGLRDSIAAAAIGVGGLYAYSSLVGPHHAEQPEWDEWGDYEYEAYDQESPRQAPPY
jgi:hypothetical protein